MLICEEQYQKLLKMEVNIEFVIMASSESKIGDVSKKLKKLTETYDWIIKADV